MLVSLIPIALSETIQALTELSSHSDSSRFAFQVRNMVVDSALKNQMIILRHKEFFGETVGDDWQAGAHTVERLKGKLVQNTVQDIEAAIEPGSKIVGFEVEALRNASRNARSMSQLACRQLPVYKCMEVWYGLGLTGLSPEEAFGVLASSIDPMIAGADSIDSVNPLGMQDYIGHRIKNLVERPDFTAPVPVA